MNRDAIKILKAIKFSANQLQFLQRSKRGAKRREFSTYLRDRLLSDPRVIADFQAWETTQTPKKAVQG